MKQEKFLKVNVQETSTNLTEGQFKFLERIISRNYFDGLYTKFNDDIINKIIEDIQKVTIPRFLKWIEENKDFVEGLEPFDISTDDLKSLIKKYAGDINHSVRFKGSVTMTRQFNDVITLTKDKVQYLIDEYGKNNFDIGSYEAEELLEELGSSVEDLDYDEEYYEELQHMKMETPITIVSVNLPSPKDYAPSEKIKEVA